MCRHISRFTFGHTYHYSITYYSTKHYSITLIHNDNITLLVIHAVASPSRGYGSGEEKNDKGKKKKGTK